MKLYFVISLLIKIHLNPLQSLFTFDVSIFVGDLH